MRRRGPGESTVELVNGKKNLAGFDRRPEEKTRGVLQGLPEGVQSGGGGAERGRERGVSGRPQVATPRALLLEEDQDAE